MSDIEAPVKFIVLKIHNNSAGHRRISATGYVEWVLGDLRSKYNAYGNRTGYKQRSHLCKKSIQY